MSCADTSGLSMVPSQSQPQTSQSPLKPITPVRSSTFRRHSTVSGDMLLSRKRALMLGDEHFDKKGTIPLNDENNANLSLSRINKNTQKVSLIEKRDSGIGAIDEDERPPITVDADERPPIKRALRRRIPSTNTASSGTSGTDSMSGEWGKRGSSSGDSLKRRLSSFDSLPKRRKYSSASEATSDHISGSENEAVSGRITRSESEATDDRISRTDSQDDSQLDWNEAPFRNEPDTISAETVCFFEKMSSSELSRCVADENCFISESTQDWLVQIEKDQKESELDVSFSSFSGVLQKLSSSLTNTPKNSPTIIRTGQDSFSVSPNLSLSSVQVLEQAPILSPELLGGKRAARRRKIEY